MKLIATDTQTLLVYESTSLKWAAQLPFTPLVMKRGQFAVSIARLVEIQKVTKKIAPKI